MEKSYLITLNQEELEQLVLRGVRQAIQELVPGTPQTGQSRVGGIDLACEVTMLSKATIYTKVSRRQIPHRKIGNRLHFRESELIDWIDGLQRKTTFELDQEANYCIQTRSERYVAERGRPSNKRSK